MSIYLPPIARKKKVERVPRHSKMRVFSDLKEHCSSKSIYQQDFLKFDTSPASLRLTSPSRRNKPQPSSVTFNWKNTRSLCEPVCCVKTERVKNEQANWWPTKIPIEERYNPSYSLESTSRSDYRPTDIARYMKSRSEETKHSIEVQKSKATGREKISFEHQYNSRLPDNQPQRGKLHGSFINEEIYV